MINIDSIRGIDYRHSAFSVDSLTLRFFSNHYCEQFIKEHPELVIKRQSPGAIVIAFAHHDYKVVQDYLKNYALENNLDPDNNLAAQVFAGAINYAGSVFSNCLMLGGTYSTNREDKAIILEHLAEIMRILVKYESKGN